MKLHHNEDTGEVVAYASQQEWATVRAILNLGMLKLSEQIAEAERTGDLAQAAILTQAEDDWSAVEDAWTGEE